MTVFTWSLVTGLSRNGASLAVALHWGVTQNLAAYPVADWVDALKRRQQEATRVTAPGSAAEIVTLKPIALNMGRQAISRPK